MGIKQYVLKVYYMEDLKNTKRYKRAQGQESIDEEQAKKMEEKRQAALEVGQKEDQTKEESPQKA